MNIKSLTIKNYKSIRELVDLEFNSFNIAVGQNNHGKTNLLEAIEWFYNSAGDILDIKNKSAPTNEDVEVSIIFSGLAEGLSKMYNEKNKTTLIGKLGDDMPDEITIRRVSSEKVRSIQVNGQFIDPGVGFDKALNDLLPTLEYIPTSQNIKEITKYSSKSQIGQMLGGVINEILKSSDTKYSNFVDMFSELFISEDSTISLRLNELANTTAGYLQKQFSDCEKVYFEVKEPKLEELLKGFEVNLDDGFKTKIEEKGDGMQRALMLAIIQTYADYRKKNESIKNFIFIIDEAEIHLHPTAQRNLKKSLLELCASGDQVIITSHSSVLISEEHTFQNLFKVEKIDKETYVQIFDKKAKASVVFDLLGGNPADLLLPSNFLLVEGLSDQDFLKRIINRFYNDKPEIQIIPVWGDLVSSSRIMDRLSDCYAPLGKSLYKEKVIVILDNISQEKINQYLAVLKKLREAGFKEMEQIFLLPTNSIEEYYPEIPTCVNTHTNLTSRQKRNLAKCMGDNITKDEFESKMSIIFQALNNCWNKALK